MRQLIPSVLHEIIPKKVKSTRLTTLSSPFSYPVNLQDQGSSFSIKSFFVTVVSLRVFTRQSGFLTVRPTNKRIGISNETTKVYFMEPSSISHGFFIPSYCLILLLTFEVIKGFNLPVHNLII